MKKRIVILICLFSITLPVVPVWGQESNKQGQQLTAGVTKDLSLMTATALQNREEIISKYHLDMIDEARQKIDSLDTSNKEEWFKNYKAIQEEYIE